MISQEDRAIGCFLGLAIGDALGAAVQFKAPGTFDPVTGMRDNPDIGLPAGYWTDDTAMALCLAESLIRWQCFNPEDQLARYLSWLRTGYNSSLDHAFDIGETTLLALTNYEKTGALESPFNQEYRAGNGSIMRLAPISIFYHASPREGIYHAALSSKTTHSNIEALDACRLLAALTIGALNGADKEVLLKPFYTPDLGLWDEDPLTPAIAAVSAGSWRNKEAKDLPASGYVVDTLEAALWAFATTDSFEEGMLKVVNLGNDADTTGAVYGQVTGAFYGQHAFPKEWLESTFLSDKIRNHSITLMRIEND